MPRPSGNTDQRLIEAARTLLNQSSLTQMNLRQVAKKAGVNLGMFHYHFKTKDQFTQAVLQDTYDKFFKEFSLETSGDGPALERLRSALLTLSRFIGANRRMILGILHDLLNKNRVVLDFVKTNAPRHGLVVVGLVRQCQKEGSLRKMALPSIMPVLMGACLFPLVMVAMLENLEVKRLGFIPFVVAKAAVASDKAMKSRVDLMLESLAPPKGKKS
jgi:AcrR family transcriptional regulator